MTSWLSLWIYSWQALIMYCLLRLSIFCVAYIVSGQLWCFWIPLILSPVSVWHILHLMTFSQTVSSWVGRRILGITLLQWLHFTLMKRQVWVCFSMSSIVHSVRHSLYTLHLIRCLAPLFLYICRPFWPYSLFKSSLPLDWLEAPPQQRPPDEDLLWCLAAEVGTVPWPCSSTYLGFFKELCTSSECGSVG